LGERRLGLALSDPDRVLAQPHAIWPRRPPAEELAALVTLIAAQEVNTVVVGLPKRMDGSLGPEARAALDYAGWLREQLEGITVATWDERLSTAEAKRALAPIRQGAGSRRRPPARKSLDAISAALILHGYLQSLGREA
jgi:putative Holliday junction resolvase